MNQKHAQKNMPQEDLHLLPALDTEKTTRVLLIEDDRSTRRRVKAELEGRCQLLEAATASQGITSYNAFKPDIVFMDIELPDGNGQDLAAWVLRNDPGAFVVMFSGHSETGNVVRSAELGVKGFVSKPFDLRKMLYFIEMCPKLH
ncbi:MAG: response regulator [Alphaproteobacteria bacterium]|nr:response regulator [Alphaproteobacteria bacterium]